jgi:BASS family bile acid:Na+ symporter
MTRWLSHLTNAFPLWVLACGVVALFRPAWFTWFGRDHITWGLAIIMLGMGITLSLDDFKAVLKMPRAVAIGFIGQYTIMPFLGWAIAHGLDLDTPLAVGLILVSCCPGGTASNVVTYLARGNVALSVLMTMCSTFGAIVMTPLLTRWLAGTLVPVPAWGLFVSTLQVVLAPLVVGLALHHLAPRLVKTVLPVSPLVSVITIALICASIIGTSAEPLKKSGVHLLLAVFLLHAGGFLVGYLFARLLGYDPILCRTISIEVGMQNSGLGSVLATRHFTPLTALPCAISATFHSVLGSILAGLWRLRPPRAVSAPSNDVEVKVGPTSLPTDAVRRK